MNYRKESTGGHLSANARKKKPVTKPAKILSSSKHQHRSHLISLHSFFLLKSPDSTVKNVVYQLISVEFVLFLFFVFKNFKNSEHRFIGRKLNITLAGPSRSVGWEDCNVVRIMRTRHTRPTGRDNRNHRPMGR